MSKSLNLNTSFPDFKAQKSYSYNLAKPSFILELTCNVIFLSSDKALAAIEIDADEEDLKNFTVSQADNTISLKQEISTNFGSVFIENVVQTSGTTSFNNVGGVKIGGNSSFRVNGNLIETHNGKTWVNGVLIEDGVGSNKPIREPRILI